MRIVFVMLLALAFTAQASDQISSAQFTQQALVETQFMLRLCTLALQRSHNVKVRDFTDHLRANEYALRSRLEVIAHNLSANSKTTNLSLSYQRMTEQLSTAQTAEFDDHYIALQSSLLKESISLYKDYLHNGSDSEIQRFAAQSLPFFTQQLHYLEQLKMQK